MKLGMCGAWAFAVLALSTTPAVADETSSDMRCLLAFASGANSSDPTVKSAAQMGVVHFLGKLDGRTPSLDLTSRAKEEIKTMTDAGLKAQIQSCGAIFAARGHALDVMGSALDAMGKAAK